jgi:hypothetical protein
MTIYRLPDTLGGAECEIVSDHIPGYPSYVAVAVDKGRSVIVPSDWLTEVRPKLPPEPPDDSTVRIAETRPHVYHRDDHGGDSRAAYRWYVPGGDAARSWADLCALGLPVLLVPDPAAGAEPSGEGTCHTDRRVLLRVRLSGYVVCVEVYEDGQRQSVELTPEDAESVARTLWAAAEKA